MPRSRRSSLLRKAPHLPPQNGYLLPQLLQLLTLPLHQSLRLPGIPSSSPQLPFRPAQLTSKPPNLPLRPESPPLRLISTLLLLLQALRKDVKLLLEPPIRPLKPRHPTPEGPQLVSGLVHLLLQNRDTVLLIRTGRLSHPPQIMQPRNLSSRNLAPQATHHPYKTINVLPPRQQLPREIAAELRSINRNLTCHKVLRPALPLEDHLECPTEGHSLRPRL